MNQPEPNDTAQAVPSLKRRLYNILESSAGGNWLGRWFDRFMIVLIVTNMIAVILESVESLAAAVPDFFWTFELFSVAVFTVEYLARVWVCTENPEPGYGHPLFGRLRQMSTPMALIDLIAILPFYLAFVVSVDLRFMRVFRLLRLFKLTRYSSALETLGIVVYGQRRPLGAALMIMLIVLIFASSIVYLFEHDTQPETFASIPHAMWWGLATLTTVGYGDVTPVTSGGRIFGAFIMVLGVGMFALPAGILATGFADEIRKREFVVSWKLVAGCRSSPAWTPFASPRSPIFCDPPWCRRATSSCATANRRIPCTSSYRARSRWTSIPRSGPSTTATSSARSRC
ncbi:MAG: ion transporter [Rhodospirillales bacterium]|nr:ion transporter [Rhodospirillales bacterium]